MEGSFAMDDPGFVKPGSLAWKKHFLTRIYAADSGSETAIRMNPPRSAWNALLGKAQWAPALVNLDERH
jgi:hypothetical protein